MNYCEVWVNYVYDNPGYYTCEEVAVNDPCLTEGVCFAEPNCPAMDGAPIGMSVLIKSKVQT